MDGIQPYAGSPRPLVAAVHPSGPSPASVKAASDYLRAIRRRIWLVLAVAIPIATAGTLYVLRMQAVYLVSARIEIKPPQVDPAIAQIVGRGDMARGESADEKYIPDTLALLNDKGFALDVLRDRYLGLPDSALEGDPGADLAAKVKSRQIPQSHLYDITLEGTDPDRITRTLNFLLEKFAEKADTESRKPGVNAQEKASALERRLDAELKSLQEDLTKHVKTSTSLAPGGRSLKEAQYDILSQRLWQKREQVTNLQRQAQFDTLRPNAPSRGRARPRAARWPSCSRPDHKNFTKRLAQAKRIAVEPSDPAIKMALRELQDIEADMEALRQGGEAEGPSTADVYQSILEGADADIRSTEGQLTTVLGEMRDAMPGVSQSTRP